MSLSRNLNTDNVTTFKVTTIVDDLDQFVKFLSVLINGCEQMKIAAQTVKEDLRRAKQNAQEVKRKAAEEKGTLAVANVGLGIAAAVITVFTGGLALPILFGTGQVITSICSKEITSEYERNIERIIASVDQRTGRFKQSARMVINKKKTYETCLQSYIKNGIDENEASFLTICGLITEMTQDNNNSFITGGDQLSITNASHFDIQEQDLISRLSGKQSIGLMGISMASAEKYLPEWLTNATKSLSQSIPKIAPKVVGVATTIITASVEVCSAIRFALAENKAVEVIAETTQLLDEGEVSLDYFIGVFTNVRIHALKKLDQQNKDQKEIKMKEEIQRISLQQATTEAQKEKYKFAAIVMVVFMFFAFLLAMFKF